MIIHQTFIQHIPCFSWNLEILAIKISVQQCMYPAAIQLFYRGDVTMRRHGVTSSRVSPQETPAGPQPSRYLVLHTLRR